MRHLSIFPWAMNSEPAERVRNIMSEMLGYRVYKVYANRGFEPEKGQAIVDWGRSDLPVWYRPDLKWLNHPTKVANSVDKAKTFACMEGKVNHVPFTFSDREASLWLRQGHTVASRIDTRGFDGAGLVLSRKEKDLPWAPLYTKFIPGRKEYRVYVFQDKILDVLQKVPEKRIKSDEIRTEANGWGYEREGVYAPPGYAKEAIGAIKACGLDFGGVDILLDHHGKYWVLETNTAPDVYNESARRFCREIYRWLEALN